VKTREVPPAALWGIIAAVVVVIAVIAYGSFFKGPPQLDASTVSPERLLDPDRPHGAARDQAPQDNGNRQKTD